MQNEHIRFDYKDNFIQAIALNITETTANADPDYFIYVVGGFHIAQLIACNEIQASAHILTIFPERFININSCESKLTVDATEGDYLVANIAGNPFYLTYDQLYELAAAC